MAVAVAVGAGVSILPRRALRAEIDLGRLAALQMRPEITRPLALLHRRGRKLNQATLRFLELLLENGRDEAGRMEGEPALHNFCNT